MRDDIAAALADRIDAYKAAFSAPFLEHGDSGPALSPNALVEADLLWEFSQSVQADGLVPAVVGQTLGLVRQIRARALPESDRLPELAAAVGLFSLAMYGLQANEVDAQWRWLVDDAEAIALQAHYILARRDISSPAMLDRIVELYRRACAAGCPDHPDRPRWLANHSSALRLQYLRTRQPAVLDDAVQAGREAVDSWPPGEPIHGDLYVSLEQSVWLRYELTGDLADLDLAVVAGRAAATEPSGEAAHDAPPLADRLEHLSHHLSVRAKLTGNRRDLEEAVETARGALAVTPTGDPDRPHRLVALAKRLRARYVDSHNDIDLDTAVRYGQEAAAAAEPTDPHHALTLAEVSTLLTTRHARLWSIDDVEAAVRVGRAAVDAAPAGHRHRAHALAALAIALENRFTAFGDSASLDEAVDVIRESVALDPPSGPDRAIGEEILIQVLHLRGAPDRAATGTGGVDLDEAMLIGQRLVSRTPTGHPRLPERLHTLATMRYRRSRLGGSDPSADLSAAIDTERRALAASPPDHPQRGLFRALLATALFNQFEATGSRRHLRTALATARQAVLDAEQGGGQPDVCHRQLAAILTGSYQRFGRRADAEEAIGLWRGIAAQPAQPVASRMSAASVWAGLAASMGGWSEAVDGYEIAVDLLPLLAWRGLDVAGRERLLADWGGLAQDAAACALTTEQPDRAVVLLEQGRSVLWAQVLASRNDLSALRGMAPGLAGRLAEVRIELDRYSAATDPLTADASRYGNRGDRRMALARQFDALLAEARQLPGMQSLLLAPDARELYRTVAGGAFVIVNSSRLRSDAIVVTRWGVQVVPLPLLTHDDVVLRTRRHLASARGLRRGGRDDVDHLDAVIAREEDLADTLAWLWDAVAEPVLRAIGCDTPRPTGFPWPRVWWCPTGLLGMLPLHAAGRHDTANPGQAVLDLVVSSYAPSLRTLAMARTPHCRQDSGRILLVAAPDVPGQPVLGHVAEETDLLRALLPGGRHTLVSGAAATRDRVLAELAIHPWVHFSCHGYQNLAAPATGGIALRDGTLTVADLTGSDATGGEFAFLSACDTALGGVHVPDESITLAAALHHIGYRTVVATLWPTLDNAAAQLVGQVYRRLTRTGRFRPEHASDALHEAVRSLRATAPTTPSVWAPFVHVGA
jgi:hypothetical protein